MFALEITYPKKHPAFDTLSLDLNRQQSEGTRREVDAQKHDRKEGNGGVQGGEEGKKANGRLQRPAL